MQVRYKLSLKDWRRLLKSHSTLKKHEIPYVAVFLVSQRLSQKNVCEVISVCRSKLIQCSRTALKQLCDTRTKMCLYMRNTGDWKGNLDMVWFTLMWLCFCKKTTVVASCFDYCSPSGSCWESEELYICAGHWRTWPESALHHQAHCLN